jgi:hypothetical protein
MKAYICLFALLPIFCFAQQDRTNAAAKPSTTDCPDFKNKGKKTSKAEYFQYLRTAKPQQKQQTNYTTNSEAKVQPNTIQKNTRNTEKTDELKPIVSKKDKKQLSGDKPEKEKSTAAIPKENPDETVPQEPKVRKSRKKDKMVEEKSTASAVSIEGKKEDKKIAAGSTDNSTSETKEKPEEENTKLKQKLTRLTRKTTKVRKHSNSKCPSF